MLRRVWIVWAVRIVRIVWAVIIVIIVWAVRIVRIVRMGQINWETSVCNSNQQLRLYCKAALKILQPGQRNKDVQTKKDIETKKILK